jgi:hypothetical protein
MVISNLGAKPLVLQVPIGAEDQFQVGGSGQWQPDKQLWDAVLRAGCTIVLPAESANQRSSLAMLLCAGHSLPLTTLGFVARPCSPRC